jgi:hypothetical protein
MTAPRTATGCLYGPSGQGSSVGSKSQGPSRGRPDRLQDTGSVISRVRPAAGAAAAHPGRTSSPRHPRRDFGRVSLGATPHIVHPGGSGTVRDRLPRNPGRVGEGNQPVPVGAPAPVSGRRSPGRAMPLQMPSSVSSSTMPRRFVSLRWDTSPSQFTTDAVHVEGSGRWRSRTVVGGWVRSLSAIGEGVGRRGRLRRGGAVR